MSNVSPSVEVHLEGKLGLGGQLHWSMLKPWVDLHGDPVVVPIIAPQLLPGCDAMGGDGRWRT